MSGLTEEEKAQHEISLSRKNTTAFQQAIQRLQDTVDAQAKTIHSLQSTVQTLSAKLDSIELLTRIQKAQLTGTGPTVRS